MNKIFIEGYDDQPVISFEHIAPEPNRNCTESSSYSIWGMDQNSIKNVDSSNHGSTELLIEWIE